MAQTIRLKRSSVPNKIPGITNIELGEIAINTVDGRLYIKKEVAGVEEIILVNETEVGGREWSASKQYLTGDIVSYNGDGKVYIAVSNNIGSDPSWLMAWHDTSNPRYNVGDFDPSLGSEYPSTTGERSGAVWYITDLSPYATPPAPAGGYAMTTGPFAGIRVYNDDKFVWYGKDAAGVDVWLHEKAPENALEKGGINFNSTVFYAVGDVVTDNSEIYIALFDVPASATPPSTDPTNWKQAAILEHGGIVWKTGIGYLVGDIVSENGDVYVCSTAHTSTTFAADVGNWITSKANSGFDTTAPYEEGDVVIVGDKLYVAPVGGVPAGVWDETLWTPVYSEKSGIAYTNTTVYEVGDLVTENGITYIALSAGVNGDPSLTPTDWKVVGGSGTYNTTVPYEMGEMVTVGDNIYIAPAGGINVGDPIPTANPTPWLLSNPERGGVLWDALTNYVIGDIVTEGGLSYIALTINNTQPSLSPVDWKLLASTAPSYDSALSYNEGDIISEGGLDYIVPEGATAAPGDIPPAAPWIQITIDSERGGVAWNVDYFYASGDIVTRNGVPYLALTSTDGDDPELFPGNWKQISSPVYDPTETYTPDDTTTGSDGNDYVVPPGGVSVGDDPTATPTEWVKISNYEVGGILWDVSYDYVVGDIVTDAGIAYVCILDIPAIPATTNPSLNPTNWKEISPSTTSTVYNSEITYNEGDIVSDGNDLYVAPVGGVTPADSTPGAPFDVTDGWAIATPNEIGGIAYNGTISYAVGDLVTQDSVTYQCSVATLGTVATPVVFNIDDWSLTGLSTVCSFATTGPADLPTTWSPDGGTTNLSILEGNVFRISDITLGTLVGTQTVAVDDMIIALVDNPSIQAEFLFNPGMSSLLRSSRIAQFNTLVSEDFPSTFYGEAIVVGNTYRINDVTNGSRVGAFPVSPGDLLVALVDNPGTIPGSEADWNATSGVDSKVLGFAETTGTYPGLADITAQSMVAGTSFLITSTTTGYLGINRIKVGTRITALVDNPTLDSEWNVDYVTVAGEAWNPLWGYFAGELITVVDNTYVALQDTPIGWLPGDNISQPTIGDFWRSSERSGRLWNGAYNYLIGDTAVFNEIFYLALTNSTNAQPDSSTTNWKTIDSNRYNVGTFTPDNTNTGVYDPLATNNGGSSEYPDYTGQTPGATWLVEGLPGPSSSTPGYVLTDGPGIGITILNGDKYVLIQPTDTVKPTDWYLEIAPRVSGERAGLAWASHLDYYTGDIVSEAGAFYMAVGNMIGGTSTSPATTPAQWTALDIYGRAWNTNTNYIIGDQVSYNGETYVSLGLGSGNTPTGVTDTNWKITSVGRGVEWIATEVYSIGDVVSYGTEVYTCTAAGAAGTLPTVVANWKIAGGGEGIEWTGAKTYAIGDVVTQSGTVYVAKTANTNIDPDTATATDLNTNWAPHFGGLAKTPMTPTGGITSSFANGLSNILSTTADHGAVVGIDLITIGEGTGFINIDSTVNNPITLKNDIAIQARDAGVATVNLVSRTSKAANTPPATGLAGTYNEEVILGDGNVTSAIRSVVGNEPVVRHGTFGTTDDFRIVHEGNIRDYEKGGIEWEEPRKYVVGDIVSAGYLAWTCIFGHESKVGDVVEGSPVESNATRWKQVGTEVGGRAHSPTEAYVIGDQVSRVTGSGAAAATLTYTCTTTHGAKAWVSTDWQDNNDAGTY